MADERRSGTSNLGGLCSDGRFVTANPADPRTIVGCDRLSPVKLAHE
jgi:hypothetical protein